MRVMVKIEVMGTTDASIKLFRVSKELGLKVRYIDTTSGSYSLVFSCDISFKDREGLINYLSRVANELERSSNYCEIVITGIIGFKQVEESLRLRTAKALHKLCGGRCIRGFKELRCVYVGGKGIKIMVACRERGVSAQVLNPGIKTALPDAIIPARGMRCGEEDSLKLAIQELLGFLNRLRELTEEGD